MAIYRGRLAPSPTGYLHLGHARTFWVAQQRARQWNGVLILRNEDLDPQRSRKEYIEAMFDDLRWFGFEWEEGPDKGGANGPYSQAERFDLYQSCLERLMEQGSIYPCICSRREVLAAAGAPHENDGEAIYPGTCRPPVQTLSSLPDRGYCWRFQVPDGRAITFLDRNLGRQEFVAGRDFGDFVVWRQDGVPAYQLAVVADDAAMRITEVVRGADLLLSTARQLLLYEALQFPAPEFFHCPLVRDADGERLSKRHAALSLRQLRREGRTPDEIRQGWGKE